MSLTNAYKCEKGVQAMTKTVQFSKLLNGLEECNEEEQMQKIKELNEMINEMDEEEFKSVFTEELFDKIHQMIEEKTLSLQSAILLLKNAGYYKELKCFICYSFDESSLSESLKEVIINENEKKKDEKLLADLCECYTMLGEDVIFGEVLSIIVPCLLKIASKKEENEESQKEVEMTLLALSNFGSYFIEQKLYLNEIKEIIEYCQEHHNLTRLAYQSAWKFLICRLYEDYSMEEVITNELHFAREAAKELGDLSKCMDWKRKEERRKETEVKEVLVIEKWFNEIFSFLNSNALWNEELAGLISSIVQVFRASRNNHKDIRNICLSSLRYAAEKRNVKIDDLLKSGAIDLFSEEMKQSTLDDAIIWNCLRFFMNITERLKEKTDDEKEEEERKLTKRIAFEKMEEEGYEDAIACFHKVFEFQNEHFWQTVLSLNIYDYFVNV